MPPPRIKLPAADTAAGGSQMEYIVQRALGFCDEWACLKRRRLTNVYCSTSIVTLLATLIEFTDRRRLLVLRY